MQIKIFALRFTWTNVTQFCHWIERFRFFDCRIFIFFIQSANAKKSIRRDSQMSFVQSIIEREKNGNKIKRNKEHICHFNDPFGSFYLLSRKRFLSFFFVHFDDYFDFTGFYAFHSMRICKDKGKNIKEKKNDWLLLTSIGKAMKIEWLTAQKSNKQQLLLMFAALNCSESWHQNSVKERKKKTSLVLEWI